MGLDHCAAKANQIANQRPILMSDLASKALTEQGQR